MSGSSSSVPCLSTNSKRLIEAMAEEGQGFTFEVGRESMWWSLASRLMANRAFETDPQVRREEIRFVRATNRSELWSWATMATSADKKFVGSSVSLSIAYREHTEDSFITRLLTHPADDPGGWASFGNAKTRKEYVQWFCETADVAAVRLFEDESVALLARTSGIRQVVQEYAARLPRADSLIDLESKLRVGLSEADQAGAERLGFVISTRSGTSFAAALCFLRYEQEIEGGLLFERDFTVPQGKPF
jgi:hypothetical protein